MSAPVSLPRITCILSVGYNGMPRGCSDDEYPWERSGDELDTKYLYVCHAELNALLNYSGFRLQGARIYTTLFPCNECTKALISPGLKKSFMLKINMPILPALSPLKK